MAEITYLYILVFPDLRIIKIGKADVVYDRAQSLKRWWGKADYDASYYLSATPDVVFRLEKSLHFLLTKYSVNYEEGDGRTELFSYDALDIALKHIDLFCSSGAIEGTLKKGFYKPPQQVSPKRIRWNYLKSRDKNNLFRVQAKIVIDKFYRINRLLIILLRKQNKIAYQYDIIDGWVYFRFKNFIPIIVKKEDEIIKMFSFEIEDFKKFIGINCCCSPPFLEDGILQYSVRLVPPDKNEACGMLFRYLSRQSECLLAMLPKRSAAAHEELPILKKLSHPSG